MSLNLSEAPYDGGVLQLRERDQAVCISEAQNLGLGDALVFRLARDLVHQVTDVTGPTAKTAFAGWFKAGDGYGSVIRRLSRASEPRRGVEPV